MMHNRIRELDIFLRVTEVASFSAAARSLDCNPSTVSKSIQRLEDRLKVRLFHRTSRVLKLTPEGERFLEGAQRVVDSLDAVEAMVSERSEDASGVLRINSSLLFAQLQLAPHMPEFLERHPRLRVEFLLTAAPIDLFENHIDVSFQSGTIADSSLIARRIVTTRWLICASPRYLDKHGAPKTVEDLHHHNCLNFLSGSFRSSWELRERRGPVVVDVKGNLGSNSAELLRQMAIAGIGIVRLSAIHVASDLAAGSLVPLLEEFQAEVEEPFYVIYPSKRHLSLRVKALLDFLQGRFAL